MEPTYSIKEIMELQFKSIDHKMDSILEILKAQNLQTEKRFAQIERELDQIKKKQEQLSIDNARYKTIWGIGATIGASLVAIIVGKFIN